ncbi:MAG: branched-chain amino acid transaminase [Candidatus Levybacteria bacterium]|nr:branched-chain amino acid transaminase [Candidatus Levybacteria bacterium]
MAVLYFQNKFVPEEEAVVSVKTHALQYGTGCFEGIRAYYNESDNALYVFRLEDHFKRMADSCKILFITLPQTSTKLSEITRELVKQNFTKEDIYIRPVAYKANTVVGNFNLQKLDDGFAIYTLPLGRYLKESGGVKANISSWRRVSGNAIPPRAKITGSYINTALAKTESVMNGYDEALFLDNENHIIEGSAENLFAVKGDTVVTPEMSEDILLGITRDTVMTLIKQELGLTVIERSIDRSEIYSFDEVFLTGTGAEIAPVVSVDGRTIGTGEVGPIAQKVMKLYYDIVHGKNEKYKHWITKIVQN